MEFMLENNCYDFVDLIYSYPKRKIDVFFNILDLIKNGYLYSNTIQCVSNRDEKFLTFSKKGIEFLQDNNVLGALSKTKQLNSIVDKKIEEANTKYFPKVLDFLNKKGFSLSLNKDVLYLKKGFGKYEVQLCSKQEIMNSDYLLKILNNTHTIIWLAMTMEDKFDVRDFIRTTIVKKYNGIRSFYSEHNTVKIVTIYDILKNK